MWIELHDEGTPILVNTDSYDAMKPEGVNGTILRHAVKDGYDKVDEPYAQVRALVLNKTQLDHTAGKRLREREQFFKGKPLFKED